MRRKDDGSFDRLWAQFGRGFEHLSDDQAQELANQTLHEARAEIASKPNLAGQA
jgi:hypothetical protein